VVVLLLTTLLSVLIGNRLGTPFDVVFVLVCVGSAMWVRPRDFFMVGVMPPLLLAGIVGLLAWFDRAAVARADDTLVQAFVSGLAHHAQALVIGYALTLALLALRQVALRRRGALRRPRTAAPAPDAPESTPSPVPVPVPEQLEADDVSAVDAPSKDPTRAGSGVH